MGMVGMVVICDISCRIGKLEVVMGMVAVIVMLASIHHLGTGGMQAR